jgi:hypothetical protein
MKGKTIGQAVQAMEERLQKLETGGDTTKARVISQVAEATKATGRDVLVDQQVKTTGNAQEASQQAKARRDQGAGL